MTAAEPDQATVPASPILLCFDGSDAATRAIEVSGALIGGGAAVVLYVWSPAALFTPLDPVGDAVGKLSGIYAELDAVAASSAERNAQAGAAIARRATFDAEPLTAHGKPWSEIVRIADERDVAAVVLGAHGAGGLVSAFPGTVATRVLQHCRQPTIVVP